MKNSPIQVPTRVFLGDYGYFKNLVTVKGTNVCITSYGRPQMYLIPFDLAVKLDLPGARKMDSQTALDGPEGGVK